MWELDCKESWAPKNGYFWTAMLEKTLESPLDCKEIQLVHPKGDRSWVFIGRTDVEAEIPVLWPPDVKSWLIGKDPDAGKDWGQEEKGMTEDEMVGWHHRLNGHGFVGTLGFGDRRGGLACCSSWVCKVSDMTDWLNWTELLTIDVVPFFICLLVTSKSSLENCLFKSSAYFLIGFGFSWCCCMSSLYILDINCYQTCNLQISSSIS